jgi:DNA-binding CsgD family transcriptional regulator
METEAVQRMLDGVGDAAYAVDERGVVSAWNEAATRVLGYRKNEILDRLCHKLLRGRDVFGNPYCGPHCALLVAARQGEAVRHFQVDLHAKAGQVVRVLCFALVIGGTKSGRFSIVHLLRPASEPLLPWPGRGSRASVSLTPRELEVLRHLADSKSTRAMANTMGISTSTVRKHVQNLMQKLGVGNRLEAVLAAVDMRLL